ncbi:hypothetical protein CEV34_4578 [Brucella pseudogrignonensis]|uniref:Uncharacterized protein n=1 Tax=Brucella pseudogrignonensis TaxID=419475 RepID=A0A256G5J4_9HYPH|nr:hypothetical protein CEV34_4578 [Brucella pseudogrignonensis]
MPFDAHAIPFKSGQSEHPLPGIRARSFFLAQRLIRKCLSTSPGLCFISFRARSVRHAR